MSVHEKTLTDALTDALQGGNQWADIDMLVRRCDAAQAWSQEFLDRASQQAKKALIRKAIRNLKDENDWPLWASIAATNDQGQEVRVYKQELLFNLEDYKQVIRFHQDRERHHKKTWQTYKKNAEVRFGSILPFPEITENQQRPVDS